MASLSPNEVSSPPWYKRLADSDTEDQHRDGEFDFLAGASTPLHVNHNKSIMFASPMKRLDRLHLGADYLNTTTNVQDELIRHGNDDNAINNIHTDEYNDYNDNDNNDNEDDENDEDDGDYGAGDQTIHTTSSSDNESDADVGNKTDSPGLLDIAPSFIPQRKRKLADSPLQMEITPLGANHTIPYGSGNLTGILANDTCDSILKVSFSGSDSTPCPTHPRKKLRFKKTSSSDDSTPSQPSKIRKPLLNISGSRKLSASEVPLIHKLNDAQDDVDESVRSLSGFSAAPMNLNSTPISQSTPANSRTPSPCIPYGNTENGVNGYHFVKLSAGFSYRTPQTRPSATYEASQRLINAYVADDYPQQNGNYEIVGEFRASAAGMMEEVEDLHVGDKRINDPYAMPSLQSHENHENHDHLELRHRYMMVSNKLPLLQHFERDLTKHEMITYINDKKSVLAFYEYIFTNEPKDEALAFLKKERLRWHPDKWVTKFDSSTFNKEIVDSLSQVINAMIDHF